MNTLTNLIALGSDQPTFSEHRVPQEQGTLYTRDYAGAGPAFVLMHGFPDNSHIYDYLIPYLTARGRRVVAFDFLGFGASDKPAGATYSFQQQLDDLKAVVRYLGLEKIVPVAHDSSGMSAINFAIECPENTVSLVILNAVFAETPAVKWPELIELFANPNLQALASALLQTPEMFGWVLNFQRENFRSSLAEKHQARYDSFLRQVIAGNFRDSPSSGPAFAQMTGQLYAEIARNTARLPKMKALDIPVKLIWGEKDPYINVGVARDFQSHLKHASLYPIPAGHWLQVDEPELVAQLMLA